MEQKQIAKGTAAGLVEYLDVLVEKGKASNGAIQPLKTAFIKVMAQVDGVKWGEVMVDGVDVDEYINRFSNLTLGKYTQKSITVYKSRMARVVGWYRKFTSQSSPGWMPQLGTRTVKPVPVSKSGQGDESLTELPSEVTVAPSDVATQQSDPKLIDYPFPLSGGLVARISLPLELTAEDADRVSRFVQTLVVSSGEQA